MTTRQDMFTQNLIDFLIEQEKRHLINRADYNLFYDFAHEWVRESYTTHPREESTFDCKELVESGEHV
jgi:hypothetical protein